MEKSQNTWYAADKGILWALSHHAWIFIIQELVMDREAWRAAVLGVSKNQTQLSDWTEPRINSTEGKMTHSHSVFQNTYMLAELLMALLIKTRHF